MWLLSDRMPHLQTLPQFWTFWKYCDYGTWKYCFYSFNFCSSFYGGTQFWNLGWRRMQYHFYYSLTGLKLLAMLSLLNDDTTLRLLNYKVLSMRFSYSFRCSSSACCVVVIRMHATSSGFTWTCEIEAVSGMMRCGLRRLPIRQPWELRVLHVHGGEARTARYVACPQPTTTRARVPVRQNMRVQK